MLQTYKKTKILMFIFNEFSKLTKLCKLDHWFLLPPTCWINCYCGTNLCILTYQPPPPPNISEKIDLGCIRFAPSAKPKFWPRHFPFAAARENVNPFQTGVAHHRSCISCLLPTKRFAYRTHIPTIQPFCRQ